MFYPAFEFCLSDAAYTGPDALKIQCGQWVTCKGVKGRITCPKKMSVCWRFSGESFASFNLRFKRACMLAKGLRRARRASLRKRQISINFPVKSSVLTPSGPRSFSPQGMSGQPVSTGDSFYSELH